jgi:hypothetical protein
MARTKRVSTCWWRDVPLGIAGMYLTLTAGASTATTALTTERARRARCSIRKLLSARRKSSTSACALSTSSTGKTPSRSRLKVRLPVPAQTRGGTPVTWRDIYRGRGDYVSQADARSAAGMRERQNTSATATTTSSADARGHAPVDRQQHAGDEVGFIGGQEQSRMGGVPGRSHPAAQGHAGVTRFAHRLGR